jgi:hypothetical protein
MITTIVDTSSHKIIKDVTISDMERVKYVAFGFFWMPGRSPFRVIYNNASPNFTVWALDKDTGIWGCFADSHDIGFDYSSEASKIYELMYDNTPESLEEIEDQLCAKFFEMAKKHTENVYNLTIRLEPSLHNAFYRPKIKRETKVVDGSVE